MQSFKFLRYALHGDLVEDRRREERERREEKIMPILMATSPSAQRRSDQLLYDKYDTLCGQKTKKTTRNRL